MWCCRPSVIVTVRKYGYGWSVVTVVSTMVTFIMDFRKKTKWMSLDAIGGQTQPRSVYVGTRKKGQRHGPAWSRNLFIWALVQKQIWRIIDNDITLWVSDIIYIPLDKIFSKINLFYYNYNSLHVFPVVKKYNVSNIFQTVVRFYDKRTVKSHRYISLAYTKNLKNFLT